MIFDTETSGLVENATIRSDKRPEIIEFSCLYGETLETMTALDLKFKPSRPISDQIVKITGITNADLADAPPFAEHAAQIKREIECSDRVIGHNISFDMEMVDFEMERCGLTVAWPKSVCTVEQTLHMRGYRINLSDLYEMLFGEKFMGAHRAGADVMATAMVYFKLIEMGEL